MGQSTKRWGVTITEIVSYYVEVEASATEKEAVEQALALNKKNWDKINIDRETMAEPLDEDGH